MKEKITKEEIEIRVIEVLKEFCSIQKEIFEHSRLREDLNLDSIGLLTLSMEVENDWQLILGEDPSNPPKTVGDVVTLIESRLLEKYKND